MRKLLAAALPFVAGGALALVVSELARGAGQPRAEPFSDSWFREAELRPKHLWPGEPAFDWGD